MPGRECSKKEEAGLRNYAMQIVCDVLPGNERQDLLILGFATQSAIIKYGLSNEIAATVLKALNGA